MRGGLEGSFVLGNRLLSRLRLVVFQNTANALRVPPVGISRLFHDFLLRRRRSARIALAPKRHTRLSRPGRSSMGLRRASFTFSHLRCGERGLSLEPET